MIPDELTEVCGRSVSRISDNDKVCRFVTYFDSTSCSICQINHLSDFADLYEIADSADMLDYLIIFSPREEEYADVVKELVERDFPYPVYVDSFGEFRRANAAIPDDKRFHSFLLDRSSHPVFVGNPIASPGLRKLFDKVLDNILENDGYYIQRNR